MSTPVENLRELAKSPPRFAALGAIVFGGMGFGAAEFMNHVVETGIYTPPSGAAAYAGIVAGIAGYRVSKSSEN